MAADPRDCAVDVAAVAFGYCFAAVAVVAFVQSSSIQHTNKNNAITCLF